jgi:predicted nuclease with RNAse H fold
MSVASYETVHTDEEILRFARNSTADIIAIDAPLNLVPGRKSIEDKNGEHFRACDRELLNRGIRFFPITLGTYARTDNTRDLSEGEIRKEGVQGHRGLSRRSAGHLGNRPETAWTRTIET